MEELEFALYLAVTYGPSLLIICAIALAAFYTFTGSAHDYKKYEESWRPQHMRDANPLDNRWGEHDYRVSLGSLGLLFTLVCISWSAFFAATRSSDSLRELDLLLLGIVLAALAWPVTIAWFKGRVGRGERKVSFRLIVITLAAYGASGLLLQR